MNTATTTTDNRRYTAACRACAQSVAHRIFERMMSRKDQLWDKADQERRRCASWLVERMRDGKPKALTKSQYREQAMAELSVSKNSFDAAWVWAIEETGRHDWYHGHALSIRKPSSPRAH